MLVVMARQWSGNIKKLLDADKIELLKKMSLDELQAAEEKRMRYNARMVCKEIQGKLDVAVAPNRYIYYIV